MPFGRSVRVRPWPWDVMTAVPAATAMAAVSRIETPPIFPHPLNIMAPPLFLGCTSLLYLDSIIH
ncbi:MAG: hypothetical protein JW925_06425 [Syntrophaceae bacterium]|nr:hypothetical protein [Syntrophaceae bacterium]